MIIKMFNTLGLYMKSGLAPSMWSPTNSVWSLTNSARSPTNSVRSPCSPHGSVRNPWGSVKYCHLSCVAQDRGIFHLTIIPPSHETQDGGPITPSSTRQHPSLSQNMRWRGLTAQHHPSVVITYPSHQHSLPLPHMKCEMVRGSLYN